MSEAIETLLAEDRRYPPSPEFAAQANAQPDIYDIPFEEFWAREARERVTWFDDFYTVLEWEAPYAKWFLGGTLNVCFNCLDRHVEAGQGDKVAFFFEGEPEGDGVDPPHAPASATRTTGARSRARRRGPTQLAEYAGGSA